MKSWRTVSLGELIRLERCVRKEDITHLPPEQLAASILQKEQRIAEIMRSIQKLLGKS